MPILVFLHVLMFFFLCQHLESLYCILPVFSHVDCIICCLIRIILQTDEWTFGVREQVWHGLWFDATVVSCLDPSEHIQVLQGVPCIGQPGYGRLDDLQGGHCNLWLGDEHFSRRTKSESSGWVVCHSRYLALSKAVVDFIKLWRISTGDEVRYNHSMGGVCRRTCHLTLNLRRYYASQEVDLVY